MSLDNFFEEEKYMPSEIETERRNRIRLAVYAFAYEFESDPLVNDGTFDALAKKINKNLKTDNELLDTFFETHFEAHTGQWIYDHPELTVLQALCKQYRNKFKYHRIQRDILIDSKTGKIIELN